MSVSVELIELNDGHRIPQLGLGVWRATPDQTAVAVREALAAGYRHVDTAAIYRNERGVGAGLSESGVPREEVFITTKVRNDAHGALATREAAAESLTRLGLDYVDLLLIHWPVPHEDRYVETWEAMIELREEGIVRSIGVSNFTAAHLRRLIGQTGVVPVLNQIELHPYMQQRQMRDVHEELGMRTECWSPLAQNMTLSDPVIEQIAVKHAKSPAQIVIRWHLDNGLIAIPKSVTPTRIRQNLDVFDFTLDACDHAVISGLDRGQRLGPDPETFG